MGEAENIISERRRRGGEVAKRASEQRRQALIRQLNELVPRVVASLERNNYPTPYDFMMIEFAGEKRAAWCVVGDGWEPSHEIYILADGQIVSRSGTTYTHEEIIAREGFYGAKKGEEVIEGLRRIIDYTPGE